MRTRPRAPRQKHGQLPVRLPVSHPHHPDCDPDAAGRKDKRQRHEVALPRKTSAACCRGGLRRSPVRGSMYEAWCEHGCRTKEWLPLDSIHSPKELLTTHRRHGAGPHGGTPGRGGGPCTAPFGRARRRGRDCLRNLFLLLPLGWPGSPPRGRGPGRRVTVGLSSDWREIGGHGGDERGPPLPLPTGFEEVPIPRLAAGAAGSGSAGRMAVRAAAVAKGP